MSFVHLHSHTHFSLGEGVSSPEAMLEAAAQRGFEALACTDTNGVYGAVEFQQAAESRGIRPILGAHLKSGGEETVALAMDERGWAALCRVITEIHWQDGGRTSGPADPKGLPRGGGANSLAPMPLGRGRAETAFSLAQQLSHDREGLILLSSDPVFLERVFRASGPEDLYAELKPCKERHMVLATARRLGVPSVVTGAVMFAHAEDWSRHRLRVAISENVTLSACPPDRLSLRDAWLRPPAELARHFPDCPEALTASASIAERCQYRIPIGRTVAPRVADHGGALEHLRSLAYDGAIRRYGTIAPVTRDRLEHELAIIGTKNFADYFLVVHDIVQHGPTHCGRGSVANSMVSYCLGITHVEPLGAGLLFERFLNPERRDPPDIDLDFPWDERDQILAYVFNRYPKPQAAMVANHNTFRLRGALREVAKVHGRPPGEIREVTRRIPWYSDDVPLSELLATHPNFQGLDLPVAWRDYAALAAPLVGTPRHLSLHPGGVVIVPTALTDYVPLEPAAKVLDGFPDLSVPVIQFEKDGAEDAGLVKIDLLGNRSLAVIRDAIAAVAAHTGHQIDYTRADPEDDEPTRALFRTGQTMGVFYTESPASRLLCAKSRADTFELLVLNTSIIRPASNRFIRLYLERLHGGPWEPLDPCLRDTLAETFGVMVYQEDVVNVCAAFAGMPLATGDGLRKALSKKRPVKQLAAYAEEFFAGAERLGRDFERAQRVWEMVMSFAGYSFCKGHSCSYIRVAQHSCYLRANYPAEFIAAVLANGGGFYAPFAYVAEAMRMGLTVRPPDVNASHFRCAGQDKELRIGFQFIKGLSQAGVDRLLAARESGQPFASPSDLRARAGLSADDLRILIKAGACDAIAGGMTRPMMLWELDGGGQAGGRTGGQLVAEDEPIAVPSLKEYTTERRRVAEYEALGFTTDSHPMRLFAERLKRFRTCRSTDLPRHVGKSVVVAGMLTTSKPVHTAKEEPMEFATFDDGDGLIETVLFPDVYRARGHVLFDQGPFLIRGLVEEEFGAITLTVKGIERLERAGDGRREKGERRGDGPSRRSTARGL
jgi:error-prone DNA polymerase